VGNRTTPTGSLFPVVGCGKCADIAAAHLLTGSLYEVMREHLEDHVFAPSIYPEVEDHARAIREKAAAS